MTGTEIYPLRHGYKGTATPELLAAVRNVITDWDGQNWITVRDTIELVRQSGEVLDDFTMMHVRMRFSNWQKRMILEIGGTVATTTATVTETKWNMIQTEKISFSAPPVNRNSSYSMTELCSFIGCENNETASKYLKAANIETATVGQRNFRLSYSDAVKFLEFVSQSPRVDLHKETAIKALESLKNPV